MEKNKQLSKSSLYTPEDCKAEMLNQLRNGKVKGSTTYIPDIDDCWTWRTKEANIWTGYANEGKSIKLRQLCLIKVLMENRKFLFCAPEDFPPEDFFDDMIHTITGQTTDKDYPNCVDEDTYMQAFDLIKDNFFFLYVEPPDNTIQRVLSEFKKICEVHDIYGCVIDPILKFARPKDLSDRDDIYASYIGSLCVDFCRATNTSFHMVMHQVTPTIDLNKRYAEPSMYRVKGGGSWADGFDNVLTVWRPDYAFDKLSPEVHFGSQKIKKQKLVGVPQKRQFSFDRKTNRYTHFGTNTPLFDYDRFITRKKKNNNLALNG